MMAASLACAQPVTSFTVVETPGTPVTVASNLAIPCSSTALGAACGTPTNLHYTGMLRRVTSIVAGGVPYAVSQATPTSVIVRRHTAAVAFDPQRQVLYYDLADAAGAPTTTLTPAGDIYLRAPYAKTIESAFVLSALNVGVDNIFQNTNGFATNNFMNVERMDVVFNPVQVTIPAELSAYGFPLFERGSGDPFRVAPLRAVNGSCASPVIGAQVASGAWGGALYDRRDIITRRDPSTQAEMRPDNSVTQNIVGQFMSFQSLGFGVGDTACGYALFAQDSTGPDATNPLQNPPGTSFANQLDVTGASGVFMDSTPSDMAVQITGLPAVAGPGSTVTGALTCTNVGAGISYATSCTAVPSGSPGATVVVSGCVASAGSGTSAVLPGGAITCNLAVTMPGLAGGADTPEITVGLTGQTSAANDTNAANNADPHSVALIDALDDGATTVPSATGGVTPSVSGNDQLSGGPANVGNTTVSPNGPSTCDTGACSALTPNPDGTITVPPGSTPGVYQVPYRLCATAAPTACDTAVATVVVTAPVTVPPTSDMVSALTCTPTSGAVGTPVSCTAICTNIGGSDALGAACVSTSAPPGATGTCPASASPLAPGGRLTCTVNFNMPPGGVTVRAGAGATNDSNGGASPTAGNNPSQASVTVPALQPIPVLSPVALLLLSVALGGVALVRRRG